MSGRYAIGFLFLTVPPDKIDVNVHPTKAEVRFQENSLVYSLVRATVKGRLLKENLIPYLTTPVGEDPEAAPKPDAEPDAGLFASPRREIAEQTLAPWERGAAADPLWRVPNGVLVRSESGASGRAEVLSGSLPDRSESQVTERVEVLPTPPAPLPEGRGERRLAALDGAESASSDAERSEASSSGSPLPSGRGARGVGLAEPTTFAPNSPCSASSKSANVTCVTTSTACQ
jgi:DNA mismatch repair protein MutL